MPMKKNPSIPDQGQLQQNLRPWIECTSCLEVIHDRKVTTAKDGSFVHVECVDERNAALDKARPTRERERARVKAALRRITKRTES